MKRFGAIFLALVCAVTVVMAGDDTFRSAAQTREVRDRFGRGSWELEDLVGAYFLFDRGGNNRTSIDYALNNTRIGIMLTNPFASGILRGNVEFLLEGFGGPIFHGPGSVVGGGTAFFRYNFIQPNARIVPYFQAGAGGVYTDIPEGARSSDAIGQSVNFNLQAVGGVRFLLNDTWSLNAEATYRHISNAGMSDPNYGIDQVGGAVGVGFSF